MATASFPTPALVLFMAGCASTEYAVRPGPGLSVQMESGRTVYVRDGQRFEHGFAGRGLVEAVRSDPQALVYAERHRSRVLSGALLVGLGVAAYLGGLVYLVTPRDRDESHAVPFAAFAVGLTLGTSGGVLVSLAEASRWDAINRYNDAVLERAGWQAPPWGRGAPAPPRPPLPAPQDREDLLPPPPTPPP